MYERKYVTECRGIIYDLDIDGIKIEFLAVQRFYYVYFSMIVCLHNLSNSNRSVLYVIIYICLICVLIKFRCTNSVWKKISLACHLQGLSVTYQEQCVWIYNFFKVNNNNSIILLLFHILDFLYTTAQSFYASPELIYLF